MKFNLSHLKRKTGTIGQGLAILAWVAFIISLFLPVHWFAYPIMQKFSAEPMMYGWEFAMTFWGDMILFLLILVPSGFDIDLLESLVFSAIYNLGNMLLILSPLLPGKLPDQVMRKIHLGVVFICALAAVAYKYVDNIQLGTSYLPGYDTWVLAYILLLAGSVFMLNKETKLTEH